MKEGKIGGLSFPKDEVDASNMLLHVLHGGPSIGQDAVAHFAIVSSRLDETGEGISAADSSCWRRGLLQEHVVTGIVDQSQQSFSGRFLLQRSKRRKRNFTNRGKNVESPADLMPKLSEDRSLAGLS